MDSFWQSDIGKWRPWPICIRAIPRLTPFCSKIADDFSMAKPEFPILDDVKLQQKCQRVIEDILGVDP